MEIETLTDIHDDFDILLNIRIFVKTLCFTQSIKN
jgi:hypothetical protein